MKELKGVIKQQRLTAAMREITTRPTAERFPGPYEVTPVVKGQTLETKDKIMSDDLKIRDIPKYAVSNNSNGITVTIGKEI